MRNRLSSWMAAWRSSHSLYATRSTSYLVEKVKAGRSGARLVKIKKMGSEITRTSIAVFTSEREAREFAEAFFGEPVEIGRA